MAPNGPSDLRADETLLVRTFFEKRENLLLFLAARSRSMAAAEDLVQDLYLKVAALPPNPEVKAPAAMLYRMASNLMVDQLRSQQRASRRNAEWRAETRTTIGEDDIVDEPAADEAIMARERVRLLTEAVAELPPQMGRAFRLHKLEGQSQARTAELMGVSVKMVEQHMQAAMKHLTRKLRS